MRRSLNALPLAARQAYEVAKLVYDAIPEKTSAAAHDAAEQMCQARNALRGTG